MGRRQFSVDKRAMATWKKEVLPQAGVWQWISAAGIDR